MPATSRAPRTRRNQPAPVRITVLHSFTALHPTIREDIRRQADGDPGRVQVLITDPHGRITGVTVHNNPIVVPA